MALLEEAFNKLSDFLMPSNQHARENKKDCGEHKREVRKLEENTFNNESECATHT